MGEGGSLFMKNKIPHVEFPLTKNEILIKLFLSWKCSEIEIQTVDPSAMESLINYAYTGEQ